MEIKKIKKYSKNLDELIVTEEFIVNEVTAESYATSFTPRSEMMIGSRSPSYNGGFTSRLVLKVSPKNKDLPITTLNFDGFSIVKAGDHISAQIPKFQEKKLRTELYSLSNNRDKIFYLDRKFNPEESAIELALRSTDGNISRRDRSINYKNFIK